MTADEFAANLGSGTEEYAARMGVDRFIPTDDHETGWTTVPNPDQPGRCPSIDPHDTLQCGRSIHEDDRCQFGGIGWKKGTPRYITPEERLARVEEAHGSAIIDLADTRDALDDALRERDEAQEWADRLAYAIAPVEIIGEHSSGNSPWESALDLAPKRVTPPSEADA